MLSRFRSLLSNIALTFTCLILTEPAAASAVIVPEPGGIGIFGAIAAGGFLLYRIRKLR